MPQVSIFRYGDVAAPFYFSAARPKIALFRQEFGITEVTAAFMNEFNPLCFILAVIRGADVRQMTNLLLGSAATSRGMRSTPTAFLTFPQG